MITLTLVSLSFYTVLKALLSDHKFFSDQLLGQDPDMSVSSGSGSDSDSDQPSPTKRRKTNSNSEFGLSDDCPPFEGLSNYVTEVAGASIQAARELRDGRADVAISWNGGR